ncbi:hypothetical protein NVP2275O_084 [Vibrio phage 2.275.O._10N.286.54.E11]|nr:hypothetical protein NVP2275O_084 [Vibrio phage 2.275.O._10N.286.54.E11]
MSTFKKLFYTFTCSQLPVVDHGRWRAVALENKTTCDIDVLCCSEDLILPKLICSKQVNDVIYIEAFDSDQDEPTLIVTVPLETDIYTVIKDIWSSYLLPANKIDYADVRGMPTVPTVDERLQGMCDKLDAAIDGVQGLTPRKIDTLFHVEQEVNQEAWITAANNINKMSASVLFASGNPLSDADKDHILTELRLGIDDECKVCILNLMYHFSGMTYAECARDLYQDHVAQLAELGVFPEDNLQTIYKTCEMIETFAELSKEETE